MLKDLSFAEASELYQTIKRNLPSLYSTLGDGAVECITDALHLYAVSGFAEECCNYDLDFCHLFCLAIREQTGHDLLPDYSCLTDWSGAKWP